MSCDLEEYLPIIQKAAEHILKIALVSQVTAEGEEIMQ
jgi:hypothetical protein